MSYRTFCSIVPPNHQANHGVRRCCYVVLACVFCAFGCTCPSVGGSWLFLDRLPLRPTRLAAFPSPARCVLGGTRRCGAGCYGCCRLYVVAVVLCGRPHAEHRRVLSLSPGFHVLTCPSLAVIGGVTSGDVSLQ